MCVCVCVCVCVCTRACVCISVKCLKENGNTNVMGAKHKRNGCACKRIVIRRYERSRKQAYRLKLKAKTSKQNQSHLSVAKSHLSVAKHQQVSRAIVDFSREQNNGLTMRPRKKYSKGLCMILLCRVFVHNRFQQILKSIQC